jgi:hypothetical protein
VRAVLLHRAQGKQDDAAGIAREPRRVEVGTFAELDPAASLGWPAEVFIRSGLSVDFNCWSLLLVVHLRRDSYSLAPYRLLTRKMGSDYDARP